MAYDRDKYKQFFESRYGAGSYNAGLSNARSIGATQAKAKIAELEYERRRKEAEKAAKNKTYDDAIDSFGASSTGLSNELDEIIKNPKKNGAARNAENIRNDPRLQEEIKSLGYSVSEFINAMYSSVSPTDKDGKTMFRSEREYNQFAKKLKNDVKKEDEDVYSKYNLDKNDTSSNTPKKKDNGPSLLKDITTPLKQFGKGVKNIFDGDKETKFSDAFKELVDIGMKTDRSPVTREATRGLTRIANTGTLGTLDQLYKKTNDGERAAQFTNEQRDLAGKVADFGYDALGYLVPGMGAYSAVRRAGAGLKPGAEGLIKLRQLAQEGAITGAGIGAAEVGVREALNPKDTTARDNLTTIGLGAGLGAVADPALYGLGKAAQSGLARYATGDVPTFSGAPSGNVVDNLRPSSPELRSTASLETTPQSNEIMERLASLSRPRGEMFPEDQLALANRTRQNELNAQRDSYNQEFEDAVTQQYDYLRNSMGQGVDTGTTSNGLAGNSREVTGRYTVSNNPQWYQEFYAQTGRRPTNQELRELAEQHVREGFSDTVGELPPWQPQAVQEIDEQIDDVVRMLDENPEQEAALRPVLEALEQDRTELLRNYENINNAPSVASNEPSLERLRALSQPQPTLRAGRDFEPINGRSGAAEEPELARVSEVLLDDARQASGNAESFRGRINETPPKKDGVFSNLRTQFIDDVAPLENLEKQIAGKVGSAENSLYKQARLFRGSPEKAHMIVQEQLGPVLRDLQANKIDYKDLRDYALAVHAKDVNSKGINSGFTNAEIDDVIRKLGSEQMEAARKKLLGVNNHVLDMLSTGDKPILSGEQVAAMKEKWPNYMSLFRSFDDDKIEFSSGMNKAMANASNPIKKLEGSSRDVIDPIESMVKNIFKAVNTVEKNKVSAQVGKLAEKDVDGQFIRKLSDKEDTSRLNVISVMDNGKKEKYEVPPDVYKTLMNLDKESTNTLIKILQKPASWLRGGATLTPEFSLRNPLRDVPNAFVVSESGFNPITDFPVGLWQSIWKGRTIKIGNKEFKTSGDLYKEWVKENGGYGNIISMDRELHRETLKKALLNSNTDYFDVLSPKSYTALIKKYANPKHPLEALRNIADVSESATKVGEFRAAKRQGNKHEKKEFNKLIKAGKSQEEAQKLAKLKNISPQEAAYRARDIMDFARAGISVREANKVVAFLNANIQGKSKLYRAFKEHPTKFTGKAVTAVTIPTIGAIVAQEKYANDKQREILNDAPQWMKDTFFLLPVPGTDQIARIPKPFDLAFPFSNTLERAFDYVKKNDKKAFDNFIRQGFSAAAVPTMLTGVAPIVEGMANYSFFRQGPIIPQREVNSVELSDQHDINTSDVAKAVGKGINKVTEGQGAFENFGSPRIIDNTIQGLFGGLGQYVTSAVDLFIPDENDQIAKPTKSIDQKPLAKAFLVNQSSSGESLDKLYTLKEKLTKARGTAKQNEKKFADEGKYKAVNDVTKDIGEISKEIRAVENHPELSSDQKKQILDQLVQLRNNIARQAMQQFEE